MSGIILNPRGVVPRAHDCNLGPEFAKIAKNLRLRGGRWEPWRVPCELLEAPKGSVRAHVRDCCWHTNSDRCSHYLDAKACRSTFLSSPNSRPLSTDDFCDPDWHLVGYPIPDDLCARIDRSSHSISGLSSDRRSYVITYGNGCEEGPPSNPVSVDCADKDARVVLELPPPPDEAWGATELNIYRTYSTWNPEQGVSLGIDNRNLGGSLTQGFGDINTETCFFLVDTIPIWEANYIDTSVLPAGRMLTTEDFFPPAEGLVIKGETDSGSLVGFIGKDLWFSEKNAYHAWPLKARMNFPHEIVDVCVCDDWVFVLTDARAFIVADTADCRDATCRDVLQAKRPFAACSQGACVALPDAVLYSSLEGLVLLSADGRTVLASDRSFAKDDWLALDPSQIRLEKAQNHLFLSTDRETYIWQMSLDELGLPADVTTVDIVPDHWVVDEQEQLYFLLGDCIFQFDAGPANMDMQWRQATQTLDRDINVSAVRVQYIKKDTANTNNVSLYRDDRVVMSRDVAEFARVRGSFGRCYSIEVRGNEPMCGLYYGPGISSLGATNE